MAPCTKVKSVLRSCLLDCSCARWACWRYWRCWFKPLVGLIYLVILVLMMPLLVWKLYRLGTTPHFKAWFVAGVFVLLTLPVFLYGLVLHLLNYTQPHLQQYIIRIIFIVPIYSIDSFLGLLYPPSAIYWTTIRNCYESFVLYSFLRYLLNFLEHTYAPLDDTLNSRPAYNPGVPCCCMPLCPKGRPFMKRCMVGVLQYTIIKVVLTLLALVTALAGVYQDGAFKLNNPFLYFTIIDTLSQIVAIIHLIYFYRGTHDLLKPLQPIGKFASIKAIIFLLFWQAVVIGILKATGVLKQGVWQNYDVDDVAQGLQDFVVCIEMLLFAIAHLFVFSHRPFVDLAAAQVPCVTSCLHMLDIRDVYRDVKHHFLDPIPNIIRFRKLEVNGEECADERGSQASELPVADTAVGEQTRLLGSDQTRPLGSDQTRLLGSDQTRLLGSDQTRLLGSDLTRPLGSDLTRPLGSDQTRLLGSDLTRPLGSDQTRPLGSDLTRSLGSDQTSPLGSDQTHPLGSDQTRPLGSDQTRLLGSDLTRPLGSEQVTELETGGVKV